MNKLEDQRRQLIQWIGSRAPQGSLRNTVTIVFDGRSDVWSPSAASSIRVVFAQGETADEKIIRMVEEDAHKKSVVVVTDDRSLQYSVRALGATVSGVQTFLEQGASARTDRPESGKNISKTLEHEITSEFAQIWIEKKKGKKT
jgi:predicted RNA-binding protein with PIN domain